MPRFSIGAWSGRQAPFQRFHQIDYGRSLGLGRRGDRFTLPLLFDQPLYIFTLSVVELRGLKWAGEMLDQVLRELDFLGRQFRGSLRSPVR